MIVSKGTALVTTHLSPAEDKLEIHQQLAKAACVSISGPDPSAQPRDTSVITSQCVKQEVQDEGSQLESQPMQTMLQTSLPATELNQEPCCVCDSGHFGSNHSGGSRSGSRSGEGESEGNKAVSRASRTPGRPPPQDSCCASLVLACLSCECASLAAALLRLCASCLAACCGRCCMCCDRCCEALQDTPAEDLHCPLHCCDNLNAILLEPCCEPVQCLDLSMECLKICHYG